MIQYGLNLKPLVPQQEQQTQFCQEINHGSLLLLRMLWEEVSLLAAHGGCPLLLSPSLTTLFVMLGTVAPYLLSAFLLSVVSERDHS